MEIFGSTKKLCCFPIKKKKNKEDYEFGREELFYVQFVSMNRVTRIRLLHDESISTVFVRFEHFSSTNCTRVQHAKVYRFSFDLYVCHPFRNQSRRILYISNRVDG